MTSTQKNSLKTTISKELQTLEKTIQTLQKLCEPIKPECALGDLTRFELIHDQEVSQQNLEQAFIRKNKLNYALSHIDNEDFGLCVSCDEEIPFARLSLIPESQYCINCANN